MRAIDQALAAHQWESGRDGIALGALVAVMALGLNGRAEGDHLPGDDAEMPLQYCSVVDPVSPVLQGLWLVVHLGPALSEAGTAVPRLTPRVRPSRRAMGESW
jgi:hypothetical protein